MYQVLYREWRPQTFSEIVGQDAIVRTLQNMLRQGRIGHAFLFCGPRGTGKTTTAKVLAKALCCESGPTAEPCLLCPACEGIASGRYVDVLEIDGASNRGIDEVRALRENVRLAPGAGRCKVYIIDEVHMLTTEAFNALLKTLEEPPEHVVFILATTEPHKVPATIISRCQRFDFHRLGQSIIQDRLQKVVESMGGELPASAAVAIARAAQGGMRDALGLLDQCISYDGLNITNETVSTVLGVVEEAAFEQIARDYAEGLADKMILKAADVLEQGKDPVQFLQGILEFFRDLMLLQFSPELASMTGFDEQSLGRLCDLAKVLGTARILNCIDVLMRAASEGKYAADGRLLVEVTLCRMLYGRGEGTAALEARLRNLEARQSTAPATTPSLEDQSSWAAGADEAPEPEPEVYQDGAPDLDEEVPFYPDITLPAHSDPEKAPGKGPVTLKQIQSRWNEAIQNLKGSVRALLTHAVPDRWDGRELGIRFDQGYSFHRNTLSQPDNQKALTNALTEAFAAPFTLVLYDTPPVKAGGGKDKEPDQEEPEQQSTNLVQTALGLFGGEVLPDDKTII